MWCGGWLPYNIYKDVRRKIRIIPLKETNFIGASDTRTSTHPLASISMHTHSYITRAVAAMDRCFTLIRVHQHDIAVRPLYGQSRFQRLLGPKALYVQNLKELIPWKESSKASYHDICTNLKIRCKVLTILPFQRQVPVWLMPFYFFSHNNVMINFSVI